MIIKSAVRGNGGTLAAYLLTDKKNDRAELLEMRGWTAATLKNALVMSEEIAHAKTQCEKPFYHVAFRLAPGETLTREQWERSADALEKRLGLDEHHRAMVMHTYKGEPHLHVVWDRIDEHTLKAAELKYEHLRCKDVARELEREFGLQRVRNEKREPERELAAPSMAEEQQARRKGQDLNAIRAAIREAWQQSRDGRSFAEALGERGLMLAQGECRDYVALDAQGGVYSIGKRTTGATAQQVRAKLADLDRATVPSVEQARVSLAERQPERQARQESERAEPTAAHEHEHPTPSSAREKMEIPAPERDESALGQTIGAVGEGREAIGTATPKAQQGIRVLDKATGITTGLSNGAAMILDSIARPVEAFAEGMASLFGGGSPAPPIHRRERGPTPDQIRAAERALTNINQSLKRGDDLDAADLRNLPKSQLERIRDGGDEYLQRMCQNWEIQQRERERENERER